MTARRATRAVYAVFILSGFAFASWASRIPQVRDGLELDPRQLGLVLLAIAIGSVISMPLAGLVVARARRGAHDQRDVADPRPPGSRSPRHRLVASGVLPVVIGLFPLGVGNGTWDVAMNVEGAAVERRLGQSIMPRFHAGFSVGTVAGALVGAGDGRARRLRHRAPDRGGGARRGRRAARRARLPRDRAAPRGSAGEPRRNPLKAWTEPRTLLIGLFVFCMPRSPRAPATTGSASRSSTATTRRPRSGSLTFAVFLAAMTVGRWFGPALLDRYGRVPDGARARR